MTKFSGISEKDLLLEKALLFASGQSVIISDQSVIISDQSVTISTLKSDLASSIAIISELQEEVARLTSLFNISSLKKTSSNSHLPPSSDLARKNQSLREKTGNPSGGQLGHKGHTLKMSETPDKIEKLRPTFCNVCGDSLASLPEVLVERRQVIDIPPIIPTTTEYQNHAVTCACGHHQEAGFPEGVTNSIQYGPNIQSFVVYNSIYQYVPFGRLQDFMNKVCNVAISQGTIENIIRRTANKAKSAYETLREAIATATFVGSDETGGKANKKKLWFWVWQNAIVTFIVAATTRSKSVISDTFPEGFPNAILCSDRLAAQLSTTANGNQLCLAHLFRDLNYLKELENAIWVSDFKALLKDAMALMKIQTHFAQNDQRVLAIEQRAEKLLAKTTPEMEWTKESHPKTITFYNAMVKRKDALFTFLYHKDVPPDNNSSERAIRIIKVKTKISGQFKSLQQEFAILRSVIDTAVKNKQTVYQAIRAIVDLPIPKKAG
jgi:transposase